MLDYADYQHILFERRDPNILWMTLNRPDVLNAANQQLHTELTQIWKTIDADPTCHVAVITGAGRGFSAGGDLQMVEDAYRNYDEILRILDEAREYVYNMIHCQTPVVSAILDKAMEVATKLATGPRHAIRFTKRSLNGWMQQAGPIFDNSIALEMINFFGADMMAGVNGLRNRETPEFPSNH